VVKAELLYGAAKSNIAERTLPRLKILFDMFTLLPFDDRAAATYGLTLVTHNQREFGRVATLKFEETHRPHSHAADV